MFDTAVPGGAAAPAQEHAARLLQGEAGLVKRVQVPVGADVVDVVPDG